MALLNSRDDPVGEVGEFASRRLADNLDLLRRAIRTLHERKRQRLHSHGVLLPIMKLKVPRRGVGPGATLVWTPAGGIPPLQLAGGMVNFRQLALPVVDWADRNHGW